MSALVFTNFGGIAPRVPARMLADNFGQRNHNLLASAQEFRPLMGDARLGGVTAGARSLYRMEHKADGSLNAGTDGGWLVHTHERSYAKGQLNDDATERTVYTRDDGTECPRVMDAKGADRPLGVPAPSNVVVNLNEVAQFTQADADEFITNELVPKVVETLRASLTPAHWVGGKPLAGYTGTYSQIVPHNTNGNFGRVVMSVAAAKERGLYGAVGYANGSNWEVTLQCAPFWKYVADYSSLEARLRALESPRDGAQLFNDERVAALAQRLGALFDHGQSGIAAARQRMDDAVKKFMQGLQNAAATAGAVGARPTEPAKPTTPQYLYGDSWGTSSAWNNYNTEMARYHEDLAEWEKDSAEQRKQQSAAVAEIQSARAQAVSAHDEITAYFNRLLGQLDVLCENAIRSEAATGDLFDVDPERIEELRYYVATYVTDWGWESAPSPLSDAIELDQNDTVGVTVPAPPAGYGITHWRLYRSSAGTNEAAFLFVDEMLITTRTYEDTVPVDGLGEVCPTFGWAMPPYREDKDSAAEVKPPRGVDPYLRGVVSMPNGIVAGFIDNFVAFCEPYAPYAWPVEYQITTEHPIVGLGVFGQTLFVGTMGYPYFISGSDSMSMSAVKLAVDQPCVSRRSIVALEQGVVYASPDGLCLASASGVQVVTAALFAREDWQALRPETIIAAAHEGVYYFWNDAGRAFALDVANAKLGEIDVSALALHRDVLTDALYAATPQGELLRLFADGRRTGRWKSRIVQCGRHEPFAWIQVDGEHDDVSPAVVRWYGDGTKRYEVSITDSLPRRLPSGRWREHELELESKARITALRLAGTTAELQQV